MKKATKAILRQEIHELRVVGRQMSGICYHMGQGYADTEHTHIKTDDLWREWNAIQRSEK